MLRLLVVVLLAANLSFWAWSTGALAVIGLAPASDRDPSRVQRQVRPEAVRVLPPPAASAALGAARAANAAATAARANGPLLLCLEAGPYANGAIEAAERTLAAALPAGSWVRVNLDVSPIHAVVLGPFPTREALTKKSEELGRLRLSFDEVRLPVDDKPAGGPAVPPGLVLGRYDDRAAAETALAVFNQRGVRTARVATLRSGGSQTLLRVDNASPALATQLRGLNGALGDGFAACQNAAATLR